MTAYTGYTSENLQTVKALIDIAAQKPNATTPVVNGFWDDLLSEIQRLIQPLLDGVTSAITSVVNSIKDTVTGVINPIVTQVRTAVEGVIEGVTGGISDAINSFVTWLQNTIGSIGDWVEGAISSIRSAIDSIGDWLANAVSGIGDWINNAVNSVVTSVGTWVRGAVNDIGTWLVNTYNNVRDAIVNTVTGVGQWITDAYNNVKEWIAGAYETVSNAVASAKTTVEEWLHNLIQWLTTAKENIVKWFWETVTKVAGWFSKEVLPRFNNAVEGAQSLIGIASKVWELISSGDYGAAFGVIDDLFKGLGIPAPIKTIHALVSTIAYFWQTVNLQFIPMQIAASKQAEINLQLQPLDNSTYASGVYRGIANEAGFYENARIGGMSKERARVALETNKPLLSPGQVQQLLLRGEIDLPTHDRLLSMYGLNGDYINLIKELYMVIPGVSDLVRMAVREAFSPEIANKFGQYEDFPKDFALWAGKQGLSEDWSKRFWAAHWDLPSPQMGFEMLHRGVISNEELTLLLRALDVMPFWREKLIQISYNPLTRVDVRRMYKMGLVTEEEVKRTYLDLGYDDTRATWLTNFTTRYYSPEDETEQDKMVELARGTYSNAYKKHIISEAEYRDFLKGLRYHPDDIDLLVQIDDFKAVEEDKIFDPSGYRRDFQKLVLQAYDRGLLHINEVKPMLIDMGYDSNEADLEINLADYNRTLKIRNIVVNQVHDQYTTFIIDIVGLHTILDQFNFTSEEIERLAEEWNIERSLRTKRPPVTDLKKFFAAGLLTLEDYLNELRGEGYNERYIDLYARTLQPKGV